MADDDEIYVDVIPRLDEGEAEKATGRLRDKFKGAGSKIGDALGSELGQELQKQVTGIISDRVSDLAQGLGEKLGGALGSGIKDLAGSVGVDLGGIVDHIGDVQGKVKSFADSFKDFKSGDIAKGVSDLGKALDGMPGPLGQITDKTSSLLEKYSSLKGNIKDVTTLFGGFEKDAPGIAGAFGTVAASVSELVGPLAAAAVLGKELADITWPGAQHVPGFGIGSQQGLDWARQEFEQHTGIHLPGSHPSGPVRAPWQPGGAPSGLAPDTGALGGAASTAPAPPSALGPAAGGGSARAAVPGGGAVGGAGAGVHTSSAITGGPIHATLVDQITGGGTGVPLVQNPDGTWTSPNPAWAHLIQRESGGRNVRQQIIDANSGGNEAEGLFQITPATWRSHGGSAFASSPLAASPQQQAAIAARILQGNPSGSDWGAGLSGRESASALMAGLRGTPASYGSGVPASPSPSGTGSSGSSGNFYKDWYPPSGGAKAGGGLPITGPGALPSLPMTGGIPGRVGGTPAPGAGAPPLPKVNEQNTYGQTTPSPIGTGQGFGLTGSGLIGLAENLPGVLGIAAASGAAYDGSGAATGAAAAVAQQMWANIGQPELNLAIQKGGQAAATAAMAPIEETWLSGGQMGAQSVGSPAQAGWTGKILSNLIGQGFNAANIAGSVQPPKKQGGEDDDSASDSQAAQPGPSGSEDDPLHVKSVNPPPSAPQGSPTSNANQAAYKATPAMAV